MAPAALAAALPALLAQKRLPALLLLGDYDADASGVDPATGMDTHRFGWCMLAVDWQACFEAVPGARGLVRLAESDPRPCPHCPPHKRTLYNAFVSLQPELDLRGWLHPDPAANSDSDDPDAENAPFLTHLIRAWMRNPALWTPVGNTPKPQALFDRAPLEALEMVVGPTGRLVWGTEKGKRAWEEDGVVACLFYGRFLRGAPPRDPSRRDSKRNRKKHQKHFALGIA
jgi:hypothetical protein